MQGVPISEVDPTAFDRFCQEMVPRLLQRCGVDEHQAVGAGDDIRRRGHAFALLQPAERRVLSAPFIEETWSYDPPAATAGLRAAVCVTVRNSAVETTHAHG